MSYLSKKERRILAAFAEAVLDVPLSGEPLSLDDVKLVDRVDVHLKCLSPDGRWAYRVFLWILEYSAWFYYRRPFRVFSRMDLKFRQHYLSAWRRSPWSPKRLLKRFLEALVVINYYAEPRVAAACGYSPNFKRPSQPSRLRTDRIFRNSPLPPLKLREGERGSYDVEILVIGSGAGGAVAASVLAKRGHQVVILEEGDVPIREEFGGPDVSHFAQRYYRHAGITATFGWPTILVPVGRTIGGTTVINSGTCLRVKDQLFDRWADEFGLKDFGGEIRKRYSGIESVLGVTLVVEPVQGPHAKKFEEGARKLGISTRPLPRNAPMCSGSGVCCFGCPTDAKLSMALTYIPSAMESGAVVYANARVERIVWSGRKVDAVVGSFLDPATGAATGNFSFRPKIVIVACGALQTPALLLHSRVPDKGGHIGRHLSIHPASKVLAEYDEPVRAWEGVPQGMESDILENEGVLLESIFMPPAYIASSLLVEGREHREVIQRYPNLSAFGFLVSDSSEGRVFSVRGQAFPYYRLSKRDLGRYKKGIVALARIFFASGARVIYPGVHTLPRVTREEGAGRVESARIRRKDLDLQAFHPLGTCRMAADPRDGALDPAGRLWGLENLYVADGSVFPTSLGVNPQITIMAAAEHIAEGIGARLRP